MEPLTEFILAFAVSIVGLLIAMHIWCRHKERVRELELDRDTALEEHLAVMEEERTARWSETMKMLREAGICPTTGQNGANSEYEGAKRGCE